MSLLFESFSKQNQQGFETGAVSHCYFIVHYGTTFANLNWELTSFNILNYNLFQSILD